MSIPLLILLTEQSRISRAHTEQDQADHNEGRDPEHAVERAEIEDEQLGHRCSDQRHARPDSE